MSRSDSGSSVFKPRARLLSLLGEQLITSEVIAVVELVKNAFDADAKEVVLRFNEVSNPEDGKIIIEDDGTGMSLDTILNVWLEPGTEFRKIQREKGAKSKLYNRPILGDKGIGRFAAHRLGNVINLTTRTKDSPDEINVEINWLMFDQDKYLAEIPVYWWTTKPSIFPGEKHGTKIVVRELKKTWSKGLIDNVREKLDALLAPLTEKYDFEIKLISSEFPELEKRKKISLSKLAETALYSFKGHVNEQGFLRATYGFDHPVFPKEQREITIEKDLRLLNAREFSNKDSEIRLPNCGPFDIRFYVWDLDPRDLGETVTRRRYTDEIKPHLGVRIYRDGFRVWPYGEPGNDWLKLDGRRVNNPTKCVSNNQILGIVNISAETNSKLNDKTDREGIIDNSAFDDFKTLVLLTISEFEWERREDRDIIALLRKKKKKYDRTTDAISKLKDKMKKNDSYKTYKDLIVNIERAYYAEVRDTIEPLVVSAGIGLSYQMPAHEIVMSIDDLQKLITSLGNTLSRIGVGGQIGETVPKMLDITDIIRKIADGALELSRRKGHKFSLKQAVDFATDIKKPTIIEEKIDLEVIEKEPIKMFGRKNLVMTCLLNILDNSIYWLSGKKDKKIKIIIDHDREKNPRVILSDNGQGIRREDLPYLGEAFWTRKPNGTGLGLFISKRSMKANDGTLSFGFFEDEDYYLQGANVILTFSKQSEIAED